MDARKQIVENQLPRIAFVVSNVIVLVFEVNWRNADPWDKAKKFARAAIAGVTDVDERPLLFLVSTHPDGKTQQQEDGFPASFFANHDSGNERSELFRDVRCVSLARFDSEGTRRDEYNADVAELLNNVSAPEPTVYVWPFSEQLWLRVLKSVAVTCSAATPDNVSVVSTLRRIRKDDDIWGVCVDFYKECLNLGS